MTAQERKKIPVYSGVLTYFPDAIAEVSKSSMAGNKQHLEGQPLHWDRTKSMDQLDALVRHLLDHARGEEFDDDGVRHLAKVAWRALAELQLVMEKKHNKSKKHNKTYSDADVSKSFAQYIADTYVL
jgi:hypothetical protein